jgi:hypothetical protein
MQNEVVERNEHAGDGQPDAAAVGNALPASSAVSLARAPPTIALQFFLGSIVFILSWLFFAVGKDAEAFLQRTDARVWHGLLALQPTIWFAAIVFTTRIWKQQDRQDLGSRKDALAFGLFVIAIAIIPLRAVMLFMVDLADAIDVANPMPLHVEKIMITTAVGGLTMAFVAATIFRGQVLLGRSREADLSSRIDALDARRSELDGLVMALGLTVAVATLAAGLLRNMTNEYGSTQEIWSVLHHPMRDPNLMKQRLEEAKAFRPFPADIVIGYGLFFSFVTGLLFIPSRRRLAAEATAICDELCPRPPKTDLAAFVDWSKNRKLVEDRLGTGEASARSALESRIPILAPLIAALLSAALSK